MLCHFRYWHIVNGIAETSKIQTLERRSIQMLQQNDSQDPV